jgi:hypothetical protein
LLVVRQHPIDVSGGQYNPAEGLLSAGPLGLLTGAALRESQYRRGFSVALPEGLDRRFGAGSQCAVSLEGLIVDATSKRILRRITQIPGTAAVPEGIRLEGSGIFSEAQLQTMRQRCADALEDALAGLVARL